MKKPTLQEIIDANPDAETFRFGDSERLCRDILGLIREGRKTATCEAMRVYAEEGDVLPVVGRRDVALNWDGTPALMLETTDVTTRRFDRVDAEFVAAQGEFRDLAQWRNVYKAYFARSGGFRPDMPLMCERFRLVEDYG